MIEVCFLLVKFCDKCIMLYVMGYVVYFKKVCVYVSEKVKIFLDFIVLVKMRYDL